MSMHSLASMGLHVHVLVYIYVYIHCACTRYMLLDFSSEVYPTEVSPRVQVSNTHILTPNLYYTS